MKNTLRHIKWKYNILKPISVAKTVLREMFIAIQADLRKQEKSQINNLTLQLKEVKKEQEVQSQQKEGNNKDQSGNE